MQVQDARCKLTIVKMQSNCEDASSVFILVGTFNPLLKKIIGKTVKYFLTSIAVSPVGIIHRSF